MKYAALAVLLVVAGAGWLLWSASGTPPAETSASPAPADDAPSDAASDLPFGARQTLTPARAPVAAAAFVVEVRDPTGAAIAGAQVACSLAAANEAGKEVVTGRDGRASFAGSAGVVDLCVTAHGYLPVSRRVEPRAGTEVVVLGVGEVLDGFVEVDGEPPQEPIIMTLHTAGGGKLELATGAGGAFSLKGLAPTWSGQIAFARTYAVTAPLLDGGFAERLRLPRPQRGLRICLTRLPCIRARLLRASDGAPITGGDASVFVTFADGSNTPLTGASVDDRGNILVPLEPSSQRERADWVDPAKRPVAAEVTLWVNGKNARNAKLEFKGAEIPADLDFGELRINAGIELCVAVRAKDGSAVEGAIVKADGERAPATDASGRTRVMAATRDPELWVAAVGYQFGVIAPSSGSGSEDDPLVLVAAQGNLLVVRVRDPERHPVVAHVQIEGSEWRIAEHDAVLYKLTRFVGAGRSNKTGIAKFTVATDDAGEASFPGLVPDVGVTVRVVDLLGATVVETQARTAPAAGRRVVDLTVLKRPIRIAGIVLDAARQPAKGANVVLSNERRGQGTSADENGRYSFDGLYPLGQSLTLTVHYAGHVEHVHHIEPVRDDVDLRLELERGYTMQVSALDPAGAPVDASFTVDVSQEGSPRKVELGVYRFRNLPAGVQTFCASIGASRFEKRHDPSLGDLRIAVPAVGHVDVDLSAALVPDEKPTYVHVELTSDGKRVHSFPARLADVAYRAAAEPLLPGAYTVVLKAEGGELRRSEITVRAGRLTTIR